MNKLRVETICVGTEILLGNIVNTNAAYLATQYASLGLEHYYQTVVGDNKERLRESLKLALGRSELVVISGGLGPTQDDITRETVAEYLGRPLREDTVTKERIKEFFKKRDMKMTDNNFRQAMVPDGAMILDNDNGTAPGLWINTSDEQSIVLLPGPPLELKAMWEDRVVPILRKNTDKLIYSTTVKVCGISESEVATILDDLITMEGDVTVAPYAKTSEVHLRVTARAEDEKAAKKLIKPVVKDIKGRLGNYVYTTHEEKSLEEVVVDLLLAGGLTVTTAESCTGGMVAARLINVPGVSEIFKSGYITYSNKAKRKLVGVRKKTLDKFGPVSAQTAKEMAAGVALFTRADVSVAVTGNAGPDSGDGDKPVGLVYIGVSVCGVVTTKEFQFTGNRQKVREAATAQALILMRRCILEHTGKDMFG